MEGLVEGREFRSPGYLFAKGMLNVDIMWARQNGRVQIYGLEHKIEENLTGTIAAALGVSSLEEAGLEVEGDSVYVVEMGRLLERIGFDGTPGDSWRDCRLQVIRELLDRDQQVGGIDIEIDFSDITDRFTSLEPDVVLRAMLHGLQETPAEWEIEGSVVRVQHFASEKERLMEERLYYS
ncbi:hypothetical protein ACFLY9_00085 [Patescibacteria group bacterium]